MASRRRTAPPPPPSGPPKSLKEGAAAVIRAATRLFDRQDGEGVEKRLLAEILFTAAFDVLDRIGDEEQRRKLARRVHAGAYERMEGKADGGFVAGNEGPSRDNEPSPGAGARSPEPRPPR
jgi:hypothetical protein